MTLVKTSINQIVHKEKRYDVNKLVAFYVFLDSPRDISTGRSDADSCCARRKN